MTGQDTRTTIVVLLVCGVLFLAGLRIGFWEGVLNERKRPKTREEVQLLIQEQRNKQKYLLLFPMDNGAEIPM